MRVRVREPSRATAEQATVGTRASIRVIAPLVVVLGVFALTAVLYWPTSIEIADLWRDSNRRLYTHGGLVLAISVYLIWRQRAQLAAIRLSSSAVGGCVVAVGSVGWLIAFNAGLLAVAMLALPLLALAAVWAIAGARLARRIAFAILYLYFALPVWDLLNPVLQSVTAFVNFLLTRSVGIPATLEGDVIHIPAGSFEIAGGCSGLHFFIVALALAALQGEIDRDDSRSRWILLGLAALLALLTNWLRVFSVIVAGHLTDMEHFLVRVDHYYFGWLLFAFAIAAYLYLSSRVPRQARVVPESTPPDSGDRRGSLVLAAALSIAALALGPAWSLASVGRANRVDVLSPPVPAGWSGPQLCLSEWRPFFANADEEFLVAYYDAAASEVALYHAAYHLQRQGRELRGYDNSVVGARYRASDSHPREIEAGGAVVPLVEQTATMEGEPELLVWSLFAVDGRPDSMGLAGQIAYGVRTLWQPPKASVIALASECLPDCDHARHRLEAFARAALPAMLSPSSVSRADASDDEVK